MTREKRKKNINNRPLKFELLTPAAGKKKKKKPWPLFIERIKKRKEKKRKGMEWS